MTDSRPDQSDAETDQPDQRNTGGALAMVDHKPPSASALVVPRVIAELGEAATLTFVDFFAANIRNPNTRAAHAVAVRRFFQWLEKHGLADLAGIRTYHVSPMWKSWPRGTKPRP
jgi:hypothetical protein